MSGCVWDGWRARVCVCVCVWRGCIGRQAYFTVYATPAKYLQKLSFAAVQVLHS